MSRPVPPPYLRTKLVPHAKQVCQLYKAALYDIRSRTPDLLDYRFAACILRARFDENRDIKDPILAKKLLQNGWKEYNAKKSPFPFTYPTAPGGVAYNKSMHTYDFHFDTWHPLEKLQYPDYFAKREKRKQEFVDRWVKRYGQQEEEPVH